MPGPSMRGGGGSGCGDGGDGSNGSDGGDDGDGGDACDAAAKPGPSWIVDIRECPTRDKIVLVKMEYPCTHFINGSLVHSREEKVNQNLVGGVAAGGLGCLKAYLTLSQRPPIATVGNLVLAPALSLCRPPRTERDAARGAPPRGAPGGNGRRSTAMTRRSSWIRCALCRYLGGLPFDTTLLDG